MSATTSVTIDELLTAADDVLEYTTPTRVAQFMRIVERGLKERGWEPAGWGGTLATIGYEGGFTIDRGERSSAQHHGELKL